MNPLLDQQGRLGEEKVRPPLLPFRKLLIMFCSWGFIVSIHSLANQTSCLDLEPHSSLTHFTAKHNLGCSAAWILDMILLSFLQTRENKIDKSNRVNILFGT